MTMYRIQKDENRLQPFRSDKFSDRYLEKDLEDWFEANSIVLTDGEPCLIIGRQVNTEGGGTIDLLGIDAEGSVLVVELKRAPTPRDIVAQALEYAAWVSSLDEEAVRVIAEEYISKTKPAVSIEEAWGSAFGGNAIGEVLDTPAVIPLSEAGVNERQRIILVIEGRDDRSASMVRYLRSYGLDINLLEYNFYKTEAGEEILDIEVRIGREEAGARVAPHSRHTEEALLAKWPAETVKAYHTFRDRVIQEKGLVIRPQKTSISFFKSTRDRRVFVSYFGNSVEFGAYISYRKDSLEQYLDVEDVTEQARSELGPDIQFNEGNVWVSIYFPLPSKYPERVADFVVEKIISKVE